MLPKGPYSPQENEKLVLNFWLNNGFYKLEYDPDTDTILSHEELIQKLEKLPVESRWCLICPPPNAYSRPHIGNISGYAYQDALARYARMTGKTVLVIPGKDHAGLEGEAVFIREVLEKQGRNKWEMNRDEFFKEIWNFFEENIHKARIDEQNIGLSADFAKDTFTLDKEIVDIILDTFIEMYNNKMIYKGVRVVNWDTKANTPVADNQVIYQDSITSFYYFKYIIDDPDPKAFNLRNIYGNKKVIFQTTVKDYVSDNHLCTSYFSVLKDDNISCIPVGYSDEYLKSNMYLEGIVIGIEMRLDKQYRLIVLNPNLDISNVEDKTFEVWQNLSKFTTDGVVPAGSHFLLFNKCNELKYYCNGLIIGTTRPETIFADTAIACHPDDKRYADYINKKIRVKFLGQDKYLYFISDYFVDKNFGTGLLKITPAHSMEDWEIAQRHPDQCMPPIQVINKDLKLNFLCGKYAGMSIQEARQVLEKDMFENGNLVYVNRNYTHRIAIAERTKAPIEPLLSSQWYLSYDVPIDNSQLTLRKIGISLVESKEVQIHPDNMKDRYFHWMYNLRDWAISRTLWWGYRLPVWYHGEVKEEINSTGQLIEYIKITGTNEWIPIEYDNKNHILVQKEKPGEGWYQDDSVLDTWFSSGQWVYATLMKYNLEKYFLPTNVLVSGYDILENWDSRMIMFTYFKFKKPPFKNLYLTGLVLGPDGQKMSKSRGNIIDIDEVRNVYGTDAVRLAYFYQNTAGANYALTYQKLQMFKQFCNKIWNASKYVLQFVHFFDEKVNFFAISECSNKFAKKLLDHISGVKKMVIKNIENYQFGLATFNLYNQFWHYFCDLLIEESKKELNSSSLIDKTIVASALIYSLKEYLKLMHPFIPFITERIWWELPKLQQDKRTIMYSRLS
ncbi:MAG: class I tRNA ligase family protein [Candidatus Dojkabacteria bacterium]|nr:class I tRNA ligase family protein [Candidatus Dojkabacteria bacterium]